jgi:hypothetical protein
MRRVRSKGIHPINEVSEAYNPERTNWCSKQRLKWPLLANRACGVQAAVECLELTRLRGPNRLRSPKSRQQAVSSYVPAANRRFGEGIPRHRSVALAGLKCELCLARPSSLYPNWHRTHERAAISRTPENQRRRAGHPQD